MDKNAYAELKDANNFMIGEPDGSHVLLRNKVFILPDGWLGKEELEELWKDNDWIPVPDTDWLLNPYSDISILYDTLGFGTYDLSLPQSFYDEYREEHGESPIGVWCYDNSLFGFFVSFETALNALSAIVIAKEEKWLLNPNLN